jgi:hypothetical protein
MSDNPRKDINEYTEYARGFAYRPNSMKRVNTVNELNRLHKNLIEFKESIAELEWAANSNNPA